MRALWFFVLGTAAFVLISYFEQVPVLGWLGAVVSVVAWVTLGRALARDGGSSMAIGGILGAWTGFRRRRERMGIPDGQSFRAHDPGSQPRGRGLWVHRCHARTAVLAAHRRGH